MGVHDTHVCSWLYNRKDKKMNKLIDEVDVRKIFEKHSMEKSPELELFDTDAIIEEIANLINLEKGKLIKEIRDGLPNYKRGYTTDRANPDYHRARGFNTALDQISELLDLMEKKL